MSQNEHTGKEQKTPVPSDKYRDGWDRIFGNKLRQDEGDPLAGSGATPH